MLARFCLAALVTFAAAAAPALAADQPISATRLVIKEGKVVFISRDPAFLFPVANSGDDPTIVGAQIDLFPQNPATGAFPVPMVDLSPWKDTRGENYIYVNTDAPNGPSPVRYFSMRQGTRLKAIVRDNGSLLSEPHGSIGIRITTGSLRSCALFEDAAVRRDDAGAFIGKDAVAASLPDCSDDVLTNRLCNEQDAPACGGSCPFGQGCVANGSVCECQPFSCDGAAAPQCNGTCPPGQTCFSDDGVTCGCTVSCESNPFPPCDGACGAGSECGTQDLSSCMCISETLPCGDTAPVCNGTCGAGEECAEFYHYPLPICGCLPVGSTPCNGFAPGSCNGDCEAGKACQYLEVVGYPEASGCGCSNPGCGFGGMPCSPGQHCLYSPPNFFTCVPD